jgi:hypothetical protein
MFASPDQKYHLTLGKNLVIGGSGTTPVAISLNFNTGANNEEGIENVTLPNGTTLPTKVYRAQVTGSALKV